MASTYVNDLRLNEMATGDGSGTWGTTTNTNLELIAEAFSYGTEVITTNADTHTTTIADGATDPGRSLYLKYTGTLDSACTITIGPNTVSKVWIIENGTSGSQNIIISQGSGANITIPAGDTKVVYSDGAGAGAAFFDAFASLSVVDLKVQDDLTVTDAALVTGVLTTTATQVATGGITSGSDIISDTDSTDSLGSTGVRWLKGWFDTLTAGTLTVGSGSVTDSSGAISFGDENLTTTGIVTAAGTSVFTNLDISGDIDVDGTTNLDVVDIDGALTQDGGAVFNEASADVDFRVESDNDANALFVQGSDGFVGIGTASPTDKLHIGTNSGGTQLKIQSAASSNNCILHTNGTTDSWRTGMNLALTDGSYEFYDDVNNVSRMVIDSSGNVNITSNWLQLFGNNTLFSSSGAGGLIIQSPSGADTTIFRTSSTTERFRIASNARLTINGSATANAHGNFVGEVGAAFRALSFENTVGGGECGTVTTTASTTSYNTTSDYRLKENVVPMTGSIDRVKALKPSRFNFIVDADKTVDGFLAHEAQEVVPECVTGTKDAMRDEEYEVTPAVLDDDGNVVTEAVMGTRSVPEMQGIDQSKLVPLLTAALQEAITKIEDLTTRLETLENA
jgi:hypothetical protein